MSDVKATPRDLRKRMFRLEAEAHRLEMVSSLQRLRNPMELLKDGAPHWLGMLGGTTGKLGAVAGVLSGARLSWIVKAIPLAMAGWRIAQRLRGLMATRRRR